MGVWTPTIIIRYYKRLSIITPETFLRGAAFAMSSEKIEYKVMAGVDGDKDAVISGNIKFSGLDIMASYKQRAFTLDNTNRGALALGATFEGLPAGIKLTAGFISPVIEGTPEFGDAALNLSVSFSLSPGGNLSLAGYLLYTMDDEGINENYLGVALEEFLAYVEPGVKLSDYLSFGLPIEFHKFHASDVKEQIWIVPTLYIYPVKGVEIWLWAQAILYTESGDPDFYGGLETIVRF